MDAYTSTPLALKKYAKSPININDKVTLVKKFTPIVINGHWHKGGQAILENTGKTAIIQLTGDRNPSTISGGPLISDTYNFSEVQFCWGENNCNGSEHQINGTWFSMEAQVVHCNSKYKNFKQCLKHRDGFCILSYLFLVTHDAHLKGCPRIEEIADNLKLIERSGDKTELSSNCLYWMREAIYCTNYYTYLGTFEEAECATWIIFPRIIPIASGKVQQFRRLKDNFGENIIENCRKINPPNGSHIYLAIK